MRIAFDIDGTITAVPDQLKKIMKKCDFSVVLTGTLNPNATIENRVNQLKKYGVVMEDFDDLVSCFGHTTEEVAKKKGEYCRDNNIDLIFEDTELYVYWIRKISPNTACFLIYEG